MDSLLELTVMTASGCLPCDAATAQSQTSPLAPALSTFSADPSLSAAAQDEKEQEKSPTHTPPATETSDGRVGWSGIIGVEGEVTGDGRLIERNSLRWENLPLPLRYVSSDVGAHDGAVVVGRINTIARDSNGAIHASGDFDTSSPAGMEAMRQVKEGLTNGVSMDLDDVSFEVRVASDLVEQLTGDNPTLELSTDEEPDENGKVTIGKIRSDDEMRVTTDGRIRAATIVAIPAFASAKLSLIAAGPPAYPGQSNGQAFYDAAVGALRAGEQFEYLSDEYMAAAAQAETLFRQASVAFDQEGSPDQAAAAAEFADSLAVFLETDWSRAGMGDVDRPMIDTPDLAVPDLRLRTNSTARTSNPTRTKMTFATSDKGQAQVPPGNANTGQWRDLPSKIVSDLNAGIDALDASIDEANSVSGAPRAFQTALDSAKQSAGQADDAYNAEDWAGASSNAAKASEFLLRASQALLSTGIVVKGADETQAAVFTADVQSLLSIAITEMDGFAAVQWGGSAAMPPYPEAMPGELAVPMMAEATYPGFEDDWNDKTTVLASAFPDTPPSAWFSNPRLKEATALTVTKDGHVSGHLATWGTCHIGQTHKGCVTAPRSHSGYSYFATGTILTKEGSQIPVGHITMNTGHANERAHAASAAAHYDNTGSVVADVAIGEDSHGIWVAGAVRSTTTDAQIRALRAAPLSGDWRSIRGSLELVAALAVNVPGFPIPRPKGLVAGGEVQSLVAAGMIAPSKVIPPGQPGAFTVEDLRYLKRLAAREKAEDDKHALGVLTAAEALSRRVRTTELAMKRHAWRTEK